MRCIIFGGGGFIGSALADRLLLEGHQVRVFERPRIEPYRQFSSIEPIEWCTGDLSSAHDVDAAIDGVDAVIHMVSTTLPKGSNDDPVYDVQTNLVPTLHLLDAMVRKNVGKIVFASSGGTVYGPARYFPIDEEHATEPQVSYGIVKLAIEKYMLMYQRIHDIKAVILRVTNPFGERQRIETAQGAVGAFLHRALRGETIEIWGDGNIVRDYVYIGDVAEAFEKALNYSGAANIFNIGSGVGTSLNDLVVMIEQLLNRPIKKRCLPGRLIDVPVNVLSNSLAFRELGWRPKVTLDEGLARTASWMWSELAV